MPEDTETMAEGAPPPAPTPDSRETEQTPEPVVFTPPKDWKPPEATEQKDGAFDLVCTFKMKDGKLVLTKLGDTDMPEGEAGTKEEAPPDMKEYAKGIAGSFNEGGAEQTE